MTLNAQIGRTVDDLRRSVAGAPIPKCTSIIIRPITPPDNYPLKEASRPTAFWESPIERQCGNSGRLAQSDNDKHGADEPISSSQTPFSEVEEAS